MSAPNPLLSLAEATPIVCEPDAYDLAVKYGFAGSRELHRLAEGIAAPPICLHLEPVIFQGERFKIARQEADQCGAVAAFMFSGRNAGGDIVDAVALDPVTDRAATLAGRIGTLGLPNLTAPRLASPLMVLEIASQWLRSARDGVVILAAELAAEELAGVTLGVEDRAAALALHSRLAPHSRRPLQIVVRKYGERRYG